MVHMKCLLNSATWNSNGTGFIKSFTYLQYSFEKQNACLD